MQITQNNTGRVGPPVGVLISGITIKHYSMVKRGKVDKTLFVTIKQKMSPN